MSETTPQWIVADLVDPMGYEGHGLVCVPLINGEAPDFVNVNGRQLGRVYRYHRFEQHPSGLWDYRRIQ